MQVIRDFKNIPKIDGPTAVTIGVFDGVHKGHQAIIKKAVNLANSINGKCVVITFDPHPIAVLSPGKEPPTLTAIDLKADYIKQLGADYLVVIPFTNDFAQMEPENFVDDILVEKLNARYVVIGEDFSFGKNRKGNTDFLKSYGAIKGFETIVVPHVKIDNLVISSTEVRKRLFEGDINGAFLLTGRFPRFRGKVVHGFGRGSSKIGIPTANIETLYGEMLPRTGVYAGIVWVDNERLPCVIDIGISPTFGDVKKTEIQVHIIGFNRDIYGKQLDVELINRIREEKSFQSIEELKQQILKDIEKAKQLLASKVI